MAQRAATVNFFAKLSEDPEAMTEYREESHRFLEEQRQLQAGIVFTIKRQSVTFDSCKFLSNSYGEKTIETKYGVVTAETNANDVVIKNCVFENNDFGDKNIVVSCLSELELPLETSTVMDQSSD